MKLLFVVTTCRLLINPITNPTPRLSNATFMWTRFPVINEINFSHSPVSHELFHYYSSYLCALQTLTYISAVGVRYKTHRLKATRILIVVCSEWTPKPRGKHSSGYWRTHFACIQWSVHFHPSQENVGSVNSENADTNKKSMFREWYKKNCSRLV
jgi:hypothetical protein